MGYVLAMYDVRGKQEFIFRTNKLQEIVGASWIIRDIYKDYLFPAAKRVAAKDTGIFDYKNCEGIGDFTKEGFSNHLKDGYIGEVVYEGGGNFLVLYKDVDSYKSVTYEFTRSVMEHVGSLRVLGTYTEVNETLEDYNSDREALYKKHRKDEAEEGIISPWSCIPIVQVDRKSSQPYIDYKMSLDEDIQVLFRSVNYEIEKLYNVKTELENTLGSKGIDGKLSKESYVKLLKYHFEIYRIENETDYDMLTETEKEFYRENKNEKILDNLVEEKGFDSKLAVIYIDGNSMGSKVQNATNGCKSYQECLGELRTFSEDIQKTYVTGGIQAALDDEKVKNGYRIVVYAGDEINFIVKAKDAFACANNYLNYLKEKEGESACAGISVFHSHAPYFDAYRIAEETCESGKQRMKKASEEGKELKTAAFIDFHIGQGATGTSLEDIRERENGDGIISRPWMMWNKDEGVDISVCTSFEEVSKVIEFFNKIGRGNVKGLSTAAKKGSVALEFELERIYAHQSDADKEKCKEDWGKLKAMDEKQRRKIIYDVSIAYDLWFDKKEGSNGESAEEGQ